ncbi:MAG: hypothetical protein QOF89_3659 [Acidobacteriota bacterium]|jgi:hypothetical protein|nr:hypothetical protein [Acidobacteriota bacterium]
MSLEESQFEGSVFINCPFDPEYRLLAQALIFTVLECGLEPRIASERVDSGQVRVEKIRDLIRSCQFSIHDISRIEPLRRGDLPRFNMPFELGLDLGCRYYGDAGLATKQCLILEREQYRYQRVLSDIAGHDIRAHESDPQRLVLEVRNWLRVAKGRVLPSGNEVWERHNLFLDHLPTIFVLGRYSEKDIAALEVAEYIGFIKGWIAETK